MSDIDDEDEAEETKLEPHPLAETNSKLIAEKLGQIRTLLSDCEKLSDQAKVAFYFSGGEGLGYYIPVGATQTIDGEEAPGNEYGDGWQHSSTVCW